uniref:Uncharacterized protein n=1 Tax=Timema tahoe TaxID=61484 RepID=A0A7R9FFX0_9NEOP|nr:unnamed protein product [Timema tahoe]
MDGPSASNSAPETGTTLGRGKIPSPSSCLLFGRRRDSFQTRPPPPSTGSSIARSSTIVSKEWGVRDYCVVQDSTFSSHAAVATVFMRVRWRGRWRYVPSRLCSRLHYKACHEDGRGSQVSSIKGPLRRQQLGFLQTNTPKEQVTGTCDWWGWNCDIFLETSLRFTAHCLVPTSRISVISCNTPPSPSKTIRKYTSVTIPSPTRHLRELVIQALQALNNTRPGNKIRSFRWYASSCTFWLLSPSLQKSDLKVQGDEGDVRNTSSYILSSSLRGRSSVSVYQREAENSAAAHRSIKQSRCERFINARRRIVQPMIDQSNRAASGCKNEYSGVSKYRRGHRGVGGGGGAKA